MLLATHPNLVINVGVRRARPFEKSCHRYHVIRCYHGNRADGSVQQGGPLGSFKDRQQSPSKFKKYASASFHISAG